MADRFYVNDDADQDWNNTNNWSATSGGAGGAGVPTASDIAKFDTNSGANDCNLSAAGTCAGLTADSNYSGNFNVSGFDFTHAASGFDITGATGTWSLNSITWTATGDITWTSSPSNFTLSGTTLKADANLTITGRNEGTTRAVALLDIAAGVTCTMAGEFSFKNDGATNVTMTSTSTWDLGGKNIRCFSIGTFTFAADNGGSIIGVAGSDIFFNPPSGNLTCTLPAINDINIGIIINGVPANGEIQKWSYGGNLTLEVFDIIYNVGSTTGEIIVDMETFNLVLTDAGADKLITNATKDTNTGTITVNFGTGTHQVKTVEMKNDVGATINYNMESCTFEHGNTIDFTEGGQVAGTFTFTGGTSTFKYTGGSNRFLTSNGAVFNIYENGSAGGGITILDDFAAATLTLTNGLWNTNSNGMNLDNFNVDTNDAITIDGVFKLAGNIIIDAAVISFTHTGTMELDGTGVQQVTSAGETFDIIKVSNTTGSAEFLDATDCTRFLFEPGSTIKLKDGVSHTFTAYTTGDVSGVSGNLVTYESLSAGVAANFVNPVGMSDLVFVDVKDNNATNPVVAIDSIDSTGNTNWTITPTVTEDPVGLIKDIIVNIHDSIVKDVIPA